MVWHVMEWNVVVTIFEQSFRRVVHALCRLGTVERTRFHNVLLVKADDAKAFLNEVEELTRNDPQLYDSISRVAPAAHCFEFESPEEFDEKADAIVAQWAQRLTGQTFHVRLHRRGFHDPRSSSEIERHLGDTAIEHLKQLGHSGAVSFSDPDSVIAIDVVDGRAGLALWTREDLSTHRMLRPD